MHQKVSAVSTTIFTWIPSRATKPETDSFDWGRHIFKKGGGLESLIFSSENSQDCLVEWS